MAHKRSLVVLMAAIIVLAAGVAAQTDVTSEFNRRGLGTMVVRGDTLYVTALNYIYKLNASDMSKQLARVNTRCTGEVTNYNKVLLVSDSGDVISCGTGCRGRCEIRNEMLQIQNTSVKDEITPLTAVVSTDVSKSSQAVLVNGGIMLFAVAYGDGIRSQNAVNCSDSYIAISRRYINPPDSESAPFSIVTNQSINVKTSYITDFKTILHDSKHSVNYVVTIVNNKYNNRVSKLARVCENAASCSLPYTEMYIDCVYDDRTYLILTHAVIMTTERDGDVLVGTFEDILCTININDLNEELNSSASMTSAESTTCLGSDKNLDLERNNDLRLIGRESLSLNNERITALHSSSVHGCGVLLAGTSRGRVLKFVLLPNGTFHEYENRPSRGNDLGIKSIYQRTDDNFEYFVMDHRGVVRYNSSNCSEYQTCKDTMASRDPVCGWCLFQERASRKRECNNSNYDVWISAIEECVSIKLDPDDIEVNTTTNVGLTASNLPGLGSGSYFCRVNGTHVQATSNVSDAFWCQFPSLHVHGWVTVELVAVTGGKTVSLASAPAFYYSCSAFRSCVACDKRTCAWNIGSATCGPRGPDSSSDQNSCPTAASTDIYLHSGDTLSVTVQMPTGQPASFDFAFGDGQLEKPIENCTSQQNNKTFNVSCTISKQTNDRKMSFPITIYYMKKTEGSHNWTKIDSNGTISVTIYNCSQLGPTCAHCCALNSTRYQCSWLNKVCVDSTDDCDACPNPIITKIKPSNGTIGSHAYVTLTGKNFGYGQRFIPKEAKLGGVHCAGTGTNELATKTLELPDEYSGDLEKPIYVGASCITQLSSNQNDSSVRITVGVYNIAPIHGTGNITFEWKEIHIRSIHPSSGPAYGGTHITITGDNFGAGNRRVEQILFGTTPPKTCTNPVVKMLAENVEYVVVCQMPAGAENTTVVLTSARFNGAKKETDSRDLNFHYLPNPAINLTLTYPLKGFLSGGSDITMQGENLNNAQSAVITVEEDDGAVGKCKVENSTTMVCKVPTIDHLGNNLIPRKRRRRKRDTDCKNCLEVVVYINLDGQRTPFTLTYYHDPTLNQFDEDVRLYSSEQHTLTIQGENLNLVVDEHEFSVTIGHETCRVVELTENELKCVPPDVEPIQEGLTHPEVNVTVGNIHARVGYLQYKKEIKKLLFISLVVGGALFILVATSAIVGVYKYRRVGRKARRYKDRLSELEKEVQLVAREEFLTMGTAMSTVNKNLVEQGFPYHSYQQFALNAMFASDYAMIEHLIADQGPTTRTGLQKLEQLLGNKFFLASMVTTMDKQRHFFTREKTELAGNICMVLMGKMEYLQEVLALLLTKMVQKTSSGKRKGLKTLFKRCESVTEKLLSNWLSLCLYPYLKAQSGSPLYLLYVVTQKTMHSGPIDAVTGDAKYTLCEDKLLRRWRDSPSDDRSSKEVHFEAKTLTLNVVIDNGEDMYECQVLDCDTITQVKAKCLEQIYVNYPASQLTVDPAELMLLWHSGFSGCMLLKDEDNTTAKDGRVRFNTLAHYLVQDGSNMSVVDPKTHTQQEDYVNFSDVNVFMGDMSTSLIEPSDDNDEYQDQSDTTGELKRWHLVKPEDASDTTRKTEITELYLNRLFTTKQMLIQYVESLFSHILNQEYCPPPVKFLYDLLDDIGKAHKTDQSIVHAWKSDSYPLRIWANLIRSPSLLFDINEPSYVLDNLDIISQAFTEAFTSERKLTKETPAVRLVFNKEITETRERVAKFYHDVTNSPDAPEQSRNYMQELNKLQQESSLNKSAALSRLFQQIKPYRDEVVDDLLVNKATKELGLNERWMEIFHLMENEF